MLIATLVSLCAREHATRRDGIRKRAAICCDVYVAFMVMLLFMSRDMLSLGSSSSSSSPSWSSLQSSIIKLIEIVVVSARALNRRCRQCCRACLCGARGMRKQEHSFRRVEAEKWTSKCKRADVIDFDAKCALANEQSRLSIARASAHESSGLRAQSWRSHRLCFTFEKQTGSRARALISISV